ncbi:PAS domain-containing protein, partial [Candidatus Endomicrobiellum devescovinae]|uniref:PAS domain-containing protein n=1 Tax=Candidatus Endomicrobiellum devescovinae TaxID=3242322 RepID=UPI00282F3522|nr:PAS domain-containing protein [Endomicrobium sp.]
MMTERLGKRKKEAQNFSKIKSTIAMLRNFSPQKPVGNAVVYFWESHNKHLDEKEKTQATIDLIYKEFDLSTCEKYEVHTGYLSRYNHMLKPLADCTPDEIKEAIVKGNEEQNEWLGRCQPDLPGFTEKNWEDCINNSIFEDCKNLVINKIGNDTVFANAFSKSITDFALTHGTNEANGKLYIIEETSWILSLPLLHLNKPIYLIHIGSANTAVAAMFHHFPNLQKAVKWLSPRFSISSFENISEFLLDYRNAFHVGHSYAIENKESVREITNFRKEEESFQKNIQRTLEDERRKNNLLQSIIDKLPVNTYWLNRNMVYMGCNDLQAERLGLSSKEEIIGKTNYDLHSVEEADRLNKINNIVMMTSTSYEVEEIVFTKSIGKLCNYLSRKTPLFDNNGKIIGLLGLSIDITDRKEKEELQSKLKIQEELYNTARWVSHDIAQPVNVLKGYLDLNKSLKEEEKKIFGEVARSIENITDRLLIKYRGVKDIKEKSYIFVKWCLDKVVKQIREQKKEIEIKRVFNR